MGGGSWGSAFGPRVSGFDTHTTLPDDYLPFIQQIAQLYGRMATAADSDAVKNVVSAIYTAATDGTDRLRYMRNEHSPGQRLGDLTHEHCERHGSSHTHPRSDRERR